MSLLTYTNVADKSTLAGKFVAQIHNDAQRLLKAVNKPIRLNEIQEIAEFLRKKEKEGGELTLDELVNAGINTKYIRALCGVDLPNVIENNLFQRLRNTFSNLAEFYHLVPEINELHKKIPLEDLGLNTPEYMNDLERVFKLEPADYLNGISLETAKQIKEAFDSYDQIQNLKSGDSEVSAAQLFYMLDIIDKDHLPTVNQLMNSLGYDNKEALAKILGKERLDDNDRLGLKDIEKLKSVAENAKKIQDFEEYPTEFKQKIEEAVTKQNDFIERNKGKIHQALDDNHGIPKTDVPSLHSLFDLHERLTSKGLDEGLNNLYQLLSNYEDTKDVLNEVFGIQSEEEAARYMQILDAYKSIKDRFQYLPENTFQQIKDSLDTQKNGSIELGIEQTQELAERLDLSPEQLKEIAKSWRVAQDKLSLDSTELIEKIDHISEQLKDPKQFVEKAYDKVSDEYKKLMENDERYKATIEEIKQQNAEEFIKNATQNFKSLSNEERIAVKQALEDLYKQKQPGRLRRFGKATANFFGIIRKGPSSKKLERLLKKGKGIDKKLIAEAIQRGLQR